MKCRTAAARRRRRRRRLDFVAALQILDEWHNYVRQDQENRIWLDRLIADVCLSLGIPPSIVSQEPAP